MIEVAHAFEEAHNLGMATILWCYTRNNAFVKDTIDYNTAADITGQANYLGVSLQADIIKQKLPTNNGGFTAIKFAKTNPDMYSQLSSEHPIDLCRYQVLNCYSGRIGMINSGGESKGKTDFAEAIKTAVINKRAGGAGMIMGRKAFQRPFGEGVKLINSVQEIYLAKEVYIA
jgi:class I fructose-bisphosphate aldolase